MTVPFLHKAVTPNFLSHVPLNFLFMTLCIPLYLKCWINIGKMLLAKGNLICMILYYLTRRNTFLNEMYSYSFLLETGTFNTNTT